MTRTIPLAIKLGIAFVTLILLSVGLMYFLNARSIAQVVDSFEFTLRERLVTLLTDQLTGYREMQGSWLGVAEMVLSRPVRLQLGQQVVQYNDWLYPIRFTLADRDGRIVSTNELDRQVLVSAVAEALEDPSAEYEGAWLTEEEIASGIPIIVNEEREGTLLVGEIGRSAYVTPEDSEFLEGTMRSALLGGGIATGVAVVLSLVLIAQFLRPLGKLTRATERIAQGDLPKAIDIRSRDEIGRLGHSFSQMVDGLRTSEKLRQTMTADIAHELRTPVTIIQGTLEAILDGVYDASDSTIAPIYEETLHLGRLIDDLRDLAQAEAGELHLEKEPTDVGVLARQVAETVIAAVESAPRLVIHADPDLPTIDVDPMRFRQVLANLVSNAARHTPVEGEIRIDVRRVRTGIELRVSDTGTGIAREDLPHLFERFYRGDPARNRTGGTGLGLAITKQWVEAHGGTIWAENRPTTGARFVVQIPIS